MKNLVVVAISLFVVNVFSAEMSAAQFNLAVDKAVNFIVEKENFRSRWYCDGCGSTLASRSAKCTRVKCKKATPTIGHGLTRRYWTGETISRNQSLAIVKNIVIRDAKAILRSLDKTPTTNQLAALCSLAYRRGVTPVLRSQTFAAVKCGNINRAVSEWRGFNTSGGRVMRGLINRCNAEIKLFLA